jgi:hypothetical protein
MPLSHGKSKKAFSHNVEVEMDAGKPQKQAVAIAYSEKRRAKHEAHGGMASWSSCPECMSDGGEVEADNVLMNSHRYSDPGYSYASGGYAEEGGAGMEDGGEADAGDVDSELDEMCAEELLQAIESKDKKQIVEAIKALIMSCKS